MAEQFLSVLLIEDNLGDARLVQEALAESKSIPFRVEHFTRLSAGLERLARGGIDVLLTDLHLPDSQGINTFLKAKAQAPDVPIVVLTGSYDTHLGLEAVGNGAQDYLVKGYFDGALLARAIGYSVERHRLRLELQESSETRFRHIIESNADGMVIVDKKGTVCFVNKAGEALFGCKAGEFTGQRFGFLPLVKGERRELTILRDGGGSAVVEMRVVETEWRNQSVYLASLRDISERKRAEEAIQLQASLLDAVGQAVIATSLDGTVTYCNRFVETLFGWKASEVISCNILEVVIPPASRPLGLEIMARASFGGSWNGETELRHQDGHSIPCLVTVTPILNDQGVPVGLIGIASDITERKSLEAQLRQAQKMEAVGRLAGGVAHDFNNLLVPILGYAELSLLGMPPDHPLYNHLTQIKDAAEMSSNLTRQLLAFSRRQVLNPQILNLNDLLRNMERLVRRVIGEDIVFTIHLAPELGQVRVDTGQVEQVIMNLVVNARDAMPTGGNLVIATANTTLDQEYTRQHPDVAPGEYVMLSVTDTGTGMSDEVKAHLFEPFFTTKEAGKGTGLGLATCYGIVSQSRGHIAVESELGQGSTFKIYLLRVPSQVQAPPAAAQAGAPSRGMETVLVVEDDLLVRGMEGLVLRGYGYTVLEAGDGPGALEVVQEQGREIHLLLTDVVLPGMSGKELAQRVQALHPGTRVLFTSGYTDNMLVYPDITEQELAFLQKPFSPAALAHKVRQVLDS